LTVPRKVVALAVAAAPNLSAADRYPLGPHAERPAHVVRAKIVLVVCMERAFRVGESDGRRGWTAPTLSVESRAANSRRTGLGTSTTGRAAVSGCLLPTSWSSSCSGRCGGRETAPGSSSLA